MKFQKGGFMQKITSKDNFGFGLIKDSFFRKSSLFGVISSDSVELELISTL